MKPTKVIRDDAYMEKEDFLALFNHVDDEKYAVLADLIERLPVVLCAADYYNINILADLILRYGLIQKEIERVGIFVGDRKNPLIPEANKTIEQIGKILKQYGGDYASRKALSKELSQQEQDANDPIMKILKELHS